MECPALLMRIVNLLLVLMVSVKAVLVHLDNVIILYVHKIVIALLGIVIQDYVKVAIIIQIVFYVIKPPVQIVANANLQLVIITFVHLVVLPVVIFVQKILAVQTLIVQLTPVLQVYVQAAMQIPLFVMAILVHQIQYAPQIFALMVYVKVRLVILLQVDFLGMGYCSLYWLYLWLWEELAFISIRRKWHNMQSLKKRQN